MQSSTFTNAVVAFNPLEQFQIVPLISFNIGAVEIPKQGQIKAEVPVEDFDPTDEELEELVEQAVDKFWEINLAKGNKI